MIDVVGRRMYAKIIEVMEEEADVISPPLSQAMDVFDEHMNRVNNTKGVMYDKNGGVLMRC